MNEINSKIIIPLSPNYIVDDLKFGMAKLSWTGLEWKIDQTKIVAGAVIGGVYLQGVLALPAWANLLGVAGFVYLYHKYAWTHQTLIESVLSLKHKIRVIRGTNHYSNTASPKNQIYPPHSLGIVYQIASGIGLGTDPIYSHEIRIMKNGIIQFSKKTYGCIIDCQTKQITDDDLNTQIGNVEAFLKSMQLLYKMRASSKVPYQNKVEKITIPLMNEAKDQEIKNMYASMYQMSVDAPKSPIWNVKLFVKFQSTEKEIEQYANTIIPGILDRLKGTKTIATVIMRPDQIMSIYSNDLTGHEIPNSGMPALYDPAKAIWRDELRQIMQGSINENSDHLIINRNEFATCIICGQPTGVAGFPPTLNSEIIMQLYRTSADSKHTIKIDVSVNPINSTYAMKVIKQSINKLLGNTSVVEGSMTSKMDMGLDIDSLKELNGGLKNGTINMNDINYTISVYADSYSAMDIGRSKVMAILNANGIKNKIPENEILNTIKSTFFLPGYDTEKSIWLPGNALCHLLPITRGPANVSSDIGTYMGIDAETGEEIMINLNEIAGGHKLILGSSQSGKTSAISMEINDAIMKGEWATYITNKPDMNTNFKNVGNYYSKISQMIYLGRETDDSDIVQNFNPLQILYNPAIKFNPANTFYKHIDFANIFIELITGGNRTDPQKGYIEESLIKLYIKYGIDPDDVSTWEPTIQPTLIELYKNWEHDLSLESPNSLKASTIQALCIRAKKFTTTLKWLSNQTNVSMKQLTIIDLSNVSEDAEPAIYYFLTELLKQQFNPHSKIIKNIFFDEVASLIRNPRIQVALSAYLQKAASYHVRVCLGSQQLEALAAISSDLKSNIQITEILGLGIKKYIDNVVSFAKLSNNSKEFLLSCHKPGMGILSVGYPYNIDYKLIRKPCPLVAQILFGKQEALPVPYSFVHPALEELAKEQKVIFSGWITGDMSQIRGEMIRDWQQRVIGSGKEYIYIDPSIIDKDNLNMIRIDGSMQIREHFLSVVGIAAYFAERGFKIQINHNNDADIVVDLPDGLCAFEYQTSGNNDPKRMMNKKINYENKYGRLFFIGNSQSVKEISTAIQMTIYSKKNRDSIIISRGTILSQKCKELLGEETELFEANPNSIIDSESETEV
jgi:hypothetical protein